MDRTDYTDPICPCDTDFYKEPVAPEPIVGSGALAIEAVMAEYDSFLHTEQYEAAGQYLQKMRGTAKENNDLRSLLSIDNELLGYHRQYGNIADEDQTIAECRDLLSRIDMGKGPSAGMILLNIGTALCAAGRPADALLSYSDACRSWGTILAPRDVRWAGLFNNMAGAYEANGEPDFAEQYYNKALDVLRAGAPTPDLGLTYLNLAMLLHGQNAEDERIGAYVRMALDALQDTNLPHDAYYAHTARKCTDPLHYLGFFRAAKQMEREADAIYERIRTGG